MDFKLWLETEKYRAIKNLWKSRGAPDHFMSPFKDPHRWPWPEYEIGGGKRVPQKRFQAFGREFTRPEDPASRLAKGYVGGVLTSLRKTMYPRGDFPVTYNLGLSLPGFGSVDRGKGVETEVFVPTEHMKSRKATENIEIYALAVEIAYVKMFDSNEKVAKEIEPLLNWNGYQVDIKERTEEGIKAIVYIPFYEDVPMKARLKALRKGKSKGRRKKSSSTLDPHSNPPTPETHVDDYSKEYPG